MNLILQHYNGKLDELAQLSVASIKAYAEAIGADYKLITGKPFRQQLSDQSQKVHLINEKFDEYNNIVMVDCDVFTHRSISENPENIFEAKGMGRHTQIQSELVEKMALRNSTLANKNAPYWGGAVYKFSRETRIRLRRAIPDDIILMQLDRMLKDESIMHYLAWKANISVTSNTYFSGKGNGEEWDMNSFDDIDNANFIHIRPKWTLQGPKCTKMEIYRDLVEKCVI